MAATLQDILLGPDTRPQVIADCYALIQQEISEKSGVSGTAVKLAYTTVNTFMSGHIRNMVEKLLPDSLAAPAPPPDPPPPCGGGLQSRWHPGRPPEDPGRHGGQHCGFCSNLGVCVWCSDRGGCARLLWQIRVQVLTARAILVVSGVLAVGSIHRGESAVPLAADPVRHAPGQRNAS